MEELPPGAVLLWDFVWNALDNSMTLTQDIAVGVAKLKEQMSNPMFLASRNPTDARHPFYRMNKRLI